MPVQTGIQNSLKCVEYGTQYLLRAWPERQFTTDGEWFSLIIICL